MKYLVMRFLYWMFGWNKETPEEKAFRHEREAILTGPTILIILITMVAICGMYFGKLSLKAFTISTVFIIVLDLVLFLVANAVLKWHQIKYGGE